MFYDTITKESIMQVSCNGHEGVMHGHAGVHAREPIVKHLKLTFQHADYTPIIYFGYNEICPTASPCAPLISFPSD